MNFRDRLNLMITASAVPAGQLPDTVSMTAPMTIAARAFEADQADKPAPTSIELYDGGIMAIADVGNVVVDLQGMEMGARVPLLADHQNTTSAVVGHGTPRTDGRSLTVDGVLFRSSEAGRHIIALSKEGFQWQASQGTKPNAMKRLRAGSKLNINGRTITAPDGGLLVATKSQLKEATITPVGAGNNTSAAIAAKHSTEASAMKLSAWLKAQGITVDEFKTLPASVQKTLKASFEAEHKDGEIDIKATDANTNGAGTQSISASSANIQTGTDGTGGTGGDATDPLADLRASGAAELTRQSQITQLCGTDRTELAAKAITENWTLDRVRAAVTEAELEALRASRSTDAASFNINTGALPEGVTQQRMIEASLCITGNLTGIEKVYNEDTLNAASETFRRGIGLRQLILEAAWSNGYTGRHFVLGRELLSAAFAPAIQASGFSTINLSNILGAVANKFIIAGFEAVDQSWRQISAIGSVNNFHTQNRYRLTGNFEYEELGADGQIKHGTTGEESFTISADTFAKMYTITRKDLINDDLGALTVIPRRLGRGAALKFNKVFWTEFMNNAAFFASGNNNYFDGASSALDSASLGTAVQKFRDQTDPDGDPVAVDPKLLLVPTALEVDADELFVSTHHNTGGSSTKAKVPNRNTHAGKYRPVVSPYLSNTGITGYSEAAWHLLADPEDLAVIEAVFLNGQQSPTVETADADFNQLGIQMRGYHDFGVSKQDHRGGVKSKGEA